MNLPTAPQKPVSIQRRDSDWALGLGVLVVGGSLLAQGVGMLVPVILLLAWMVSLALIFLWIECGLPGKVIAVVVGLAAFGHQAGMAMLALSIASAWRRHRGSATI